ncbi:energy transducer TonB [Microbulbifer litoralis]|uniref:energy transducer TonB n=1 Tax=Microbulbifer litoralis TaxID=2933965 RepID=UPI00202975C5|nr:energy transducer TonB [Microbulbifer sp. GX H0434]
MHPIKFAFALSLSALAVCAQATPLTARVGTQQAASDTLSHYVDTLKKHTFQNIKYPRRALERNWEGEVQLSITIDANGQVQGLEVLEESRYSNLNREALRSVERANPYPPIPAELGISSYKFTVPITFRLSQ